MICTKKHISIFLFALVCSLGILPGCENRPESKTTETSVDPEKDAMRNFFHAWLADCVNDTSIAGSTRKEAHHGLLSTAKTRISGALKDTGIQSVIGKEQLVWGPQLVLDDQGGGIYVSANLMYCIRRKDASGKVHFVVGIAGTNMVSPFDWFSEDFEVSTQVPFPMGGQISKGSGIGLDSLQQMTDPVTGQTLVNFLRSQMVTYPHAIIDVAGHSLGGALTQVYALTLKNKFTTTAVEAWVYAGPTAGDAAFARLLTARIDGYHAYNNTLDAIPHAWETDRLNELCTLYSSHSVSLCGHSLQSNQVVNGVVTFLRAKAQHGNYKMPGTPVVFTGKFTMDPKQCSDMSSDIEDLWLSGRLSDLYVYPNEIYKACARSNKDISKSAFFQFWYFNSEMSGQHTTAYFNHFFGSLPEGFKKAVDEYVPGAKSKSQQRLNEAEGYTIMKKFLKQVHAFLSSTSVHDCRCQ